MPLPNGASTETAADRSLRPEPGGVKHNLRPFSGERPERPRCSGGDVTFLGGAG
jgi:hypothetical protein